MNNNAINIFTINPTTNKPYMSVYECNSRIKNYVHLHARGLVSKVGFEDILQDIYVEVLSKPFNPLTYNATTHLYLNMKNVICNYYNYLNHPKVKMMSTTPMQWEDGEEISIEEYSPYLITPEDVLLANEKFNEFRRDNIRNAIVWGDDLNLAPSEYDGPSIPNCKQNRIKENYRDLI